MSSPGVEFWYTVQLPTLFVATGAPAHVASAYTNCVGSPSTHSTWYAKSSYPVAAHDLAARGEILLVDIRRPDEWRRTGLPQGAVALDMRRADFIAALTDAAGADRDAPIATLRARFPLFTSGK